MAAGDAAGRAGGVFTSSAVATRVLGMSTWTVAAEPPDTRPTICVPIDVMRVAGILSIACTSSAAYSDAFRYRLFASRASALSITAWRSAGHATSGFISLSGCGSSVRRMIIVSCIDSPGNGSLPVSMLNVTSASA